MNTDQETADQGGAGTAEGGSKAKRRRFGCRNVLLVVLAVLTGLAGWGYWLWSSEPEYWAQRREFIESHESEELLLMAEEAERRILSAFNEPPPTNYTGHKAVVTEKPQEAGAEPDPAIDQGQAEAPKATPLTPGAEVVLPVAEPEPEPRQVQLSMNEVNAWIDQRLDGWMKNQGKTLPDQVKKPMLAEEGGLLVLAFRYESKQVSQVVSVKLDVEILPEGKAVLRVVQVKAGRLSLPAGAIGNQLKKNQERLAGASKQKIAMLTDALDGAELDAVLPIGQDSVKLRDVQILPGGVNLVIEPDEQP